MQRGHSLNMDDDKLIDEIRKGDENSADELIKKYYTFILRYCRWHCRNNEKAEDLTQKTFLRLFKNLYKYNKKINLKLIFIRLQIIFVLRK